MSDQAARLAELEAWLRGWDVRPGAQRGTRRRVERLHRWADDVAELACASREAEQAKAWYRDHVNDEGFYDEEMWGDPFAISPQLRAALAAAGDRQEGGR